MRKGGVVRDYAKVPDVKEGGEKEPMLVMDLDDAKEVEKW